MSRIGLWRHRPIEENAGDPLEGLVNLFDVGMILAVAFLIAGLGLTLNAKGHRLESRPAAAGKERVIRDPASAPEASGRGTPVGQVFRLPNGKLVFVKAAK